MRRSTVLRFLPVRQAQRYLKDAQFGLLALSRASVGNSIQVPMLFSNSMLSLQTWHAGHAQISTTLDDSSMCTRSNRHYVSVNGLIRCAQCCSNAHRTGLAERYAAGAQSLCGSLVLGTAGN